MRLTISSNIVNLIPDYINFIVPHFDGYNDDQGLTRIDNH